MSDVTFFEMYFSLSGVPEESLNYETMKRSLVPTSSAGVNSEILIPVLSDMSDLHYFGISTANCIFVPVIVANLNCESANPVQL